MDYFVDVILPVPIQNLFTYSINKDEALFLKKGMRVTVPFGKSKVYTSIVYGIHTQKPGAYQTKEIEQILDETPIVTEIQINHWKWIASYYMCTLGEVMKAALSRAFLLESETVISLNSPFEADSIDLSDDEHLVVEALSLQKQLRIQEIQSVLNSKTILPLLHRLIEKKVITAKEEAIEQYKPKTVKYVSLIPKYNSEQGLKSLLEELSNAGKQREVILNYFQLKSQTGKNISLKELQEKSNVSKAVIKSLIDKEILELNEIQKDRVQFYGDINSDQTQLSKHQQAAFDEIKKSFETHEITLLHGVTSSGKTEIYVKLIEEVLAAGKQVLFMLPEIALTTQLIGRMQRYFGEKVAVYHSKYSINERIEVWHNLLNNQSKFQIILGARSSMFLPFQNLGLLIIDEEHEPSYKQYHPAPRYHARDAAIVLSGFHKAKVILGSATPALETFYNAQEKKYGLVTLTQRYADVKLPDIELINLRENYQKRKMKGHFSDQLLEAIQHTIDKNEQVLIFQNRRGFSPTIECMTCGHSPHCPNCDVTLTYHQSKNQLRCHYCGYHRVMELSCAACGSNQIDTKGLGTEQIETELKALFSDKTITRMDQDTTRGKHAFEKLIEGLEQGETNIMVGTQMLTKGLDFRNVSLVGVMNADNLFNHPDFRALERSFQLLLQFAGRAGRTEKQGKVIIQTYNPQHPILQKVVQHDYIGMYQSQLEERFQFKYPPYYRMIKIIVKDRKFNKMEAASKWLGLSLKNVFKENVLGPEQPPVGRIRNEYISHILLKIPKNQSLVRSKEILKKIENAFFAVKEFRSVKLTIDVDNF